LDDREAYIDWMLEHTDEQEYFIRWRWECVQDLVKWSSRRDKRVLAAFLRTPREIFIREHNKSRAYEHNYMSLGFGSTITDPWVVSVMTQTANPAKDHRVLEIGTGSGYQSALLSHLNDHVPPMLLKQLSPAGRMVIPVGPPSGQTLMRITKSVSEQGDISYERQGIMQVKFIPFKSKSGESYSKNHLR